MKEENMSVVSRGNIRRVSFEDFEVERAVAESYVAEPEVHEADVLDRRVVRGAELLDERVPGWADRIDLERFALSDPFRCVLGQIYDDETYCDGYSHGVAVLDVYSFAYGFNSANGDMQSLQDDWRLAIQARKTR